MNSLKILAMCRRTTQVNEPVRFTASSAMQRPGLRATSIKLCVGNIGFSIGYKYNGNKDRRLVL
jgi:hypothetical protein